MRKQTALIIPIVFLLAIIAGCAPINEKTIIPPDEIPATADSPGVSSVATPGEKSGLTAEPEEIFDPSFYAEGIGTQFVPLDNPVFIPAAQVDYLDPDEYVLGIVWNGEARAYPVKMAAYHHIINDEVRGLPILVTF